MLAEFRKLDESKRKAKLEDPSTAQAPRRPVPDPPKNGLIIRGYCSYLERETDKKLAKAEIFYYKENPDRWAVETQSDMLWLTETEWRSLLPANAKADSKGEPKVGDTVTVAKPIRTRFYSTIGIDYMEGSVNSLPPRDTQMTLTVERVADDAIDLRLDGYGHMGKPRGPDTATTSHSRGCEVRVLGQLRYDRKADRFTRFDLVGVGKAWGNKMNYTRREMRLGQNVWHYGIACELVTGDSAIDRIPPYNLLHYNSVGEYFGSE